MFPNLKERKQPTIPYQTHIYNIAVKITLETDNFIKGIAANRFILVTNMFPLTPILILLVFTEGREGVKLELGLTGFALGKWGSSHTGTGIWSLGMGKKC